MARSYGVAPVDRDDTVADNDNAPLLGVGAPKAEEEDGHATIVSCVGNLVMASGGILPGVVSCITSGCIGALGLWMLSRCATRTPHRKSSFFAVSKITFPSAAVFFDAAIAIKCFGVSISYLIIIKGLMPAVVHSFYHVFTAPDVNPPWWAVSVAIYLHIPVYLVCIVIFCYWSPPEGTVKPGPIHIIHFDKSFISTFPVQVFAYTCAQNLFPIYNELKSNTQPRMNTVIFTSIFSATATYEIIAVFGYLTFGSKVGPNIISMYPSTTIFIAIGQFAIVIMVMFSYPLQVHPCRGCLDKVIGGKKVDTPSSETQSLDEAEQDEAEALDPHGSHGKMSKARHVALTSAIVGFGFAIAYFVDDLQLSEFLILVISMNNAERLGLVLSFVGSTGSTTISFILPGLFYFKLFRNDPGHSRVLLGTALALALYGALIFVFCLTFNIMKYRLIYCCRSFHICAPPPLKSRWPIFLSEPGGTKKVGRVKIKCQVALCPLDLLRT
ncbi:vacuolar amino acid transporter 5 [Rhizoctonia solani AG-1 IA]|uniref:Vacuolar amino acid transporter 5 n=1 Tax=Thanatephorus cucumeris (strain AG1-IA) TaxID=983506 RepID=L8X3J4_THACA|nr:vacuolar amino acid transporter 5 [Rhizoctonia solani AG-1 IA]